MKTMFRMYGTLRDSSVWISVSRVETVRRERLRSEHGKVAPSRLERKAPKIQGTIRQYDVAYVLPIGFFQRADRTMQGQTRRRSELGDLFDIYEQENKQLP